MASEERYLWLLHYRLHGEKRLWWAYFKNRCQAEEYILHMLSEFGCSDVWHLEECEGGLLISTNYYHYKLSSQEQVDASCKNAGCRRFMRLFPLAPFLCDYRASFMASLEEL